MHERIRTIYTIAYSNCYKVELLYKHEELIQRAREEVLRSYMQNDWRTIIEIDIAPIKTLHDDLYGSRKFIAKVSLDDGSEDNLASHLTRLTKRQPPLEFIKADLGYYGNDGFESVINYEDLDHLPGVWFSLNYIRAFFDSFRSLKPWDVLEGEHRLKVLPPLIKELENELGYLNNHGNDFIKGYRSFLTNLRDCCVDIQNSNSDFDKLAEISAVARTNMRKQAYQIDI